MLNKKSLLLSFVFIFSINGFIVAQNFDFKYYSAIMDNDYSSGFRGYALAIYLNNETLENDFIDEILSIGRSFDRMTRNNNWLCWKALGEWDIADGENYLIICTNNLHSDDAIMVIATIENDGTSFSWIGRTVSTRDFE